MLMIARKVIVYSVGDEEIADTAVQPVLVEKDTSASEINFDTIEKFMDALSNSFFFTYTTSRKPNRNNEYKIVINRTKTKVPANGPFKKTIYYEQYENCSITELMKNVPANEFLQYLRENGIAFNPEFTK